MHCMLYHVIIVMFRMENNTDKKEENNYRCIVLIREKCSKYIVDISQLFIYCSFEY